jgi:tetratricopeptide (TPR) repeat protein
MRRFSSQAVVAGTIGLSLLAAGCGQVANLQARLSFRDANAAYAAQDWERAVEEYAATLARNPSDPQIITSYFFLGNSYDNQYVPSRRGQAPNDDLLNRAVENYKLAVERIPADSEACPNCSQIKTLALQYLVAAYGPEKLNDPSQAEPLLQQMIQMNPKEVPNYVLLAQLYEDAGDYEGAEATLTKAREANPGDPAVYTQQAAYFDRQGQFDKLVEALNARIAQEPSNPEAHYTIATYYFNKASRDFSISAADKAKYAQAGVDAVDKALAINNNYLDAVVYKGLLLRLQANMEKNIGRQQALLKEAQTMSDRAEELRKQKAAGLAG